MMPVVAGLGVFLAVLWVLRVAGVRWRWATFWAAVGALATAWAVRAPDRHH